MNIQTAQTAKPRTPAESALIDNFGDYIGDLSGNGDVVVARDTALELLKSNGLPSRRVESWHYTDFRTLLKGVAPFDSAAGTKPLAALLAGSTILAASNGAALDAKAPGPMRWRVEVTRRRDGAPAVFEWEESDATPRLRLAPRLAGDGLVEAGRTIAAA